MAMIRLLALAGVLALPLTAAAEVPSALCEGEKGEHKEPTADKSENKQDAAKPVNKTQPDKPADKPAGDQTGKS